MKKIIFVSIILIIGLLSFKIDSKKKNPPGTNKIEENIFFDITEVRNVDWREFMSWTKENYGKKSKEYLLIIPDTTVWNKKGLEALQEKYLTHTTFNDYPVVGISYEQALGYCKWRSDRVNEAIYIKSNNLNISNNKSNKDYPEIYKYRLPTKEEWEKIAKLDYSEKTKTQLKDKNVQRYNLHSDKGEDKMEINITAPVKSYWPNEKGIYNLIGNVAEMISEKGKAKGGSWIQNLKDINIEKDFKYEKPTNWIGFRCICEKIN